VCSSDLDLLTQEPGDLLQRAVAGLVAVRVVELLKVVEVEEDERDTGAVALGALELELELPCEGRLVEQIGKRIVASLVSELRGRWEERRDDALGDQAVDHVVQALLEDEDVRGLEGAALAHEPPKHSPEDEELGDDV